MFHIDDDLKELVESPVATVIATTDARQRPHVIYGWGPRVLQDRHSIQVFLEAAHAGQTLANLRATGLIALTVAYPISYRSVQFKGRYRDAAPAETEDEDWVRRQREAFVSTLAVIGDPPTVINNVWTDDDLLGLTFDVELAFDQTPGPEAGRPI